MQTYLEIHLDGDALIKCDLLASVQYCFEISLDDIVQSAYLALVLTHFAQQVTERIGAVQCLRSNIPHQRGFGTQKTHFVQALGDVAHH